MLRDDNATIYFQIKRFPLCKNCSHSNVSRLISRSWVQFRTKSGVHA